MTEPLIGGEPAVPASEPAPQGSPLPGVDPDAPTSTPAASDPPADPPPADPPPADPPPADPPEKKPEEEEEEEEEGAPKAPEKYEFKMPEGIELDQTTLDEATLLLQELNMTQDNAQKLVDLLIKRDARNAEAQVQVAEKYFTDRDTGWLDTLKADTEIGGTNLDKTMAGINTMIQKHDTDGKFMEFLDQNRLNNAEPLIRFLAKLAPSFAEDSVVNGNGDPSKAPVNDDPAQQMGWKSLDEYMDPTRNKY